MVTFDLTYFHKETGKAFKCARVSRIEYRMVNPETNEKFSISYYLLRKNYKSDVKNNRRTQVKKTFETMKYTCMRKMENV